MYVEAILAVVTILTSAFGAYIGVKTSVVRLEATDKRHDERLGALEAAMSHNCDAIDERFLRLETLVQRVLESALQRPCAAHEVRMNELERRIVRLESSTFHTG